MSITCEEGHKAPNFHLQIGEEKNVTLKDFAGAKLVLYFYPKDDTSGCTAEALAFQALKGEFAAAGASVLGVSPDSLKSHAKFKEKYALDMALGSDEAKETLEAYGVWVEKSMYGRKYMGVERTTFLIGADGRIAKIWRKVKVPKHADEVLKAAQAL
jgi:peroxiredoxin Q/BCP